MRDPSKDKQIKGLLTTLGLSPAEHEVFCFLFFDLPPGAGASFISMELERPRSTIYSVLNNLIKKGIVTKSKKTHVVKFIVDRKQLSEYVDRKCATLRKSLDVLINFTK